MELSRTLLLLFLLSVSMAPPTESLTTDGLALLALKFAVSSDPNGALDSWRDSDSDPCGWTGVGCRAGRVVSLSLSNSSLSGYLPSELSLLSSLETLSLSQNRFSGPIPAAVSALRSLTMLDLSHNLLSGPIPVGIAALTALSHLDLSSNFLNGTLPPALAGLSQLSGVLNLSFNQFTGKIPPEFGNIPVVVSLDLRHNNLSGEIPQVGSLVNQGPTAFSGNPELCGFPLKNPCPGSNQEPKLPEPGLGFNSTLGNPNSVVPERQKRKPAVTIPILVGIVVVAVLSVFVLQWQFRQRCSVNNQEKQTKKEKGEIPFPVLEDKREGKQDGELFVALDEGFTIELEELLRASAYVVGKSRSGIVYKVVPTKGAVVAVRRLSEADDAAESSSGGGSDKWRRRRLFESEAAAIGQARHPNVVRLQAYYYAPEEKLLIYDFIPNGTLHSALHGGPLNQSTTGLNWAARLSIVQGAARGLAYLHECSPRKYVHGSIKSTKILLDDELHPYVSGFGLTRLISTTQKLTHSASKKLGPASYARGPQSLAYVAPEARAPGSAATQKGDVYAFGMVLLEVVTGRVPGASGDGEMAVPDLEGWVRSAFKEERPLSEVVDPALLHEVHAKKQVLAVFHVALGCTELDPEMRPKVRAVSESLDRIGQ
ncbi:hypothetical protein LUZ63_002290 [Rhynchospora breviuscula]|uniref:Protein kinase domain-containing protein n=1 Tax=Rhynchospora breviuscula TaxID=2022672 RepID=A0A9Q0CYH6_9POAL|nr:hypothetical protein LUZ63_002290 [Rhynchospora breviuscula]